MSGAARIDDAVIERARSVPLAALVAKRVRLKRSGRRWSGLCPFHDESTASFSVVEDGGRGDFYHCFGCGAHGDPIEWLQRAEGLGFVEAVQALAGGEVPDGRTRFAPERRERSERRVETVDSTSAGRWIYRTSGPARGEIVEPYLDWRGLDPAAAFAPGDSAIDQVRFHPRCPVGAWRVDRDPEDHWLTHPAMVVPIRDGDGLVRGVEVSWLRADGRGYPAMPPLADGKARPKRKIFGRVNGLAAWLTEPGTDPSVPLVVGEGLETTWAFAQGFGRPCRVAAALNLNNLQGQPVRLRGGAIPLWRIAADPERPPFVLPAAGEVVVLVDADMKPLRGQRVQERRGERPVVRDLSALDRAELCGELAAQAWRRAGARSVRCVRPRMGLDFNDSLRGAA